MIKNKTNLLIFTLLISSVYLFSQGGNTIDNTGGKIKNIGKIIVKSGQVKNLNDTIGGRVEFIDNGSGDTKIPNITYNQLLFKGGNRKWVDTTNSTTKPLVTEDSILIENTANLELKNAPINSHYHIYNDTKVWGKKEFKANSSSDQNITGNGQFQILNIDNPKTVTVKNKQKINEHLILTNGTLKIDSLNGITMADSTWITRNVGAQVDSNSYIGFDKTVNVRYVGQGSLIAGNEIPQNPSTLQNFYVENDTAYLKRSITVNDTLFIAKVLNTISPISKDTTVSITYASQKDPIYSQIYSEVIGNFRRNNLKFNERNYFHNRYTYILFGNKENSRNVKEVTFNQLPTVMPGSIRKWDQGLVNRHYFISAKNDQNQDIPDSLNMQLGLAWKKRFLNDPIDEHRDLYLDRVVFKYENSTWIDYPKVRDPQVDGDWAYSFEQNVNQLGYFAIGNPGSYLPLALNIRVFLEGAFRTKSGEMTNDLANKRLLPLENIPDEYPYNLLNPADRQINIKNTPDSILAKYVDYVVIELKEDLSSTSKAQYQLAMLTKNGSLIDPKTLGIVKFNEKVDSNYYFVAIRHRNHLTVVSSDKVPLYARVSPYDFDFTQVNNVLGGTTSMKKIGYDKGGSILFGMIAGETTDDDQINMTQANIDIRPDKMSIIDNFSLKPVYIKYDTNLDGIITTKDYNISWNNRDRKSVLK